MAEQRHEPQLNTEQATVSGTTTLYGTVVGIGGENPPYLELRLFSDDILRCEIVTENAIDLARQIAQRLYQQIGVRGIAEWNITDMSLQKFYVEELTPYRKTKLDDALDALYEIVGQDLEKLWDEEQGTILCRRADFDY